MYDVMFNDLINLFQGKFEQVPIEKLKQPMIMNPFEEQRRLEAEKKAKDPKKKGPEEPEEAVNKKQLDLDQVVEECTFEKKDISYIPIHFNMNQLFKTVLEIVDPPVYPDPNTLPVPEPVFHQVVMKPNDRPSKKTIKLFNILTP